MLFVLINITYFDFSNLKPKSLEPWYSDTTKPMINRELNRYLSFLSLDNPPPTYPEYIKRGPTKKVWIINII
jgi:hypothetical protein